MHLLIMVVLFLLAGCTVERREHYEPVSLTIADVRVVGSLPVYAAIERGCFSRYGLEVKLRSWETGKLALDDVASGNAEVATAADVPATLALLAGKNLRVAAMIGISDSSNAIVWRRKSGIHSPADLRGKKVGVTRSTTAEYFLDIFLLLNHIPRDRVTRVPMPRDRLVPGLANGEVDAIATWNPVTTDALMALGPQAEKVQVRDFFDTFYLLLATPEWLAKKPAIARRLLLALNEAAQYIEDNEEESTRILRKYVPDRAGRPLDGYHFDVTLEQALIINFWNTAVWARTAGYSIPDNADFMSKIWFDGLTSIDPSLITILR